MPSELPAETAQLVDDYLQHHLGGSALPPSRTAKTLRRVADELESREKSFFRSACSPAALPEPGGAAAHLSRVAAQMEADGGLNWGRVVALVVFTGNLAAALAERGTREEISALAEALVAYLAGEKREWLEAHGGWVRAGRRRRGAGRAPPAAASPACLLASRRGGPDPAPSLRNGCASVRLRPGLWGGGPPAACAVPGARRKRPIRSPPSLRAPRRLQASPRNCKAAPLASAGGGGSLCPAGSPAARSPERGAARRAASLPLSLPPSPPGMRAPRLRMTLAARLSGLLLRPQGERAPVPSPRLPRKPPFRRGAGLASSPPGSLPEEARGAASRTNRAWGGGGEGG